MSIGHPRQSAQILVIYGLVLIAIIVVPVFIYCLLFGSPTQQQGAIGFAFLCAGIWTISKLVFPTWARRREGEAAAASEEPKK